MNILYINHYAGSPEMGMEFRPYYLSREWVKMGHHVDILAADFSHLRIRNPKVAKDFETELIDGITYHWIKTTTYVGNGLNRAVTMAQFVGKLCFNAEKIAKELKPDVIITSSTYPIDTFAGQRIKKFSDKNTILVHEVHDMWPITPMEIGGMSRWHPFIMLMQYGENSFCKNSDYVVSLLPYAKNYLIEQGMREEKFFHIANGIVVDEWTNCQKPPSSIKALIKKIRHNHDFVLCFFGSHTKSYALDYLIDAVKQIDPKKIAVLFVGNGTYKASLINKTSETSNIFFHDSIPKACIPELMKAVDGLYVGAIKNKMFRFGICMNKLFDSMMSGKPIIYAVDAPNNYINDYNCGICVEAENTEALKKGLEHLLDMSKEERERLGSNGKEAVLSYFTYKVLADKFISLIK